MTKLMTQIHNTETNEIIDREMNTAEMKQIEINKITAEKDKAKAEAKALAKSALLVKVGISQAEAKLLLG